MFFDYVDPLFTKYGLNFHPRSAYEKPQQPNLFDSPTDTDKNPISTV